MQRKTLFLIALVVGGMVIAAAAGYPASAQSPEVSQDGIVPLPADGVQPAFASELGEKQVPVEDLPGPVAWDWLSPRRDGAESAATPEPADSVSPSAPEDFAADVVRLVNEERARAGCAALAVDPILSQVAYAHSKDMGDNNFFSHVNLSGQDASDRMTAAGYVWSAAAENIAAGYSSPQAAVTGWLNSSGHLANIRNCNLCETGVGYYYKAGSTWEHYWTQVFGRPLNRACRTPVAPTVTPITPTPTLTPKTPTPTVTPKTPTPTVTVTPNTPTPTVTPDGKRKAYAPVVLAYPRQAGIATLVRNGNFELGANGNWREASTVFDNKLGALITKVGTEGFKTYSGNYAAWLGGTHNEYSSLYQYLSLPYVRGLRLRFVLYVASQETRCDQDLALVYWDFPDSRPSAPLVQIPLCKGVPYPNWASADVPLEAHGVPIGAKGWLSFDVKTDENTVSHLFIDNVSIYLAATD